MSDEAWHCKQIPNGDNPLVVCERESLLAEIDRLRAENEKWRQFVLDAGLNLVEIPAAEDRLRDLDSVGDRKDAATEPMVDGFGSLNFGPISVHDFGSDPDLTGVEGWSYYGLDGEWHHGYESADVARLAALGDLQGQEQPAPKDQL